MTTLMNTSKTKKPESTAEERLLKHKLADNGLPFSDRRAPSGSQSTDMKKRASSVSETPLIEKPPRGIRQSTSIDRPLPPIKTRSKPTDLNINASDITLPDDYSARLSSGKKFPAELPRVSRTFSDDNARQTNFINKLSESTNVDSRHPREAFRSFDMQPGIPHSKNHDRLLSKA